MNTENEETVKNTEVVYKKKTSFGRELFNFALIIIFIVIPIRFFVAQPFVVVGTSMLPTFVNNDYLIVDELTYHFENPKRGDVIVFKYHSDLAEQTGEPADGDKNMKYFIKRVIGLPGETVYIHNDTVTIYNSANPNGFVLNEPYINNPPTNDMKVTLNKDQYFMMGDNRGVSYDSRSWVRSVKMKSSEEL